MVTGGCGYNASKISGAKPCRDFLVEYGCSPWGRVVRFLRPPLSFPPPMLIGCSASPRPGTRRMSMLRSSVTLLLLFCSGLPFAVADDDPALEIARVIDQHVSAKLASEGIAPAELCPPETLLRRTTLDLAGRIPSLPERDWFLSLPQETRRIRLVDRLFSLPDFEFHLRNSLDELLLPANPGDNEFREYLLTAVRERQPWSEMFREMLLASETDGPRKGAVKFLKARVRELDDLTNDTSVLFFGVNISCAKCHDHPLVPDWKQDHFYGMQAFFNRTFSSKKNVLLEKPYGTVRFSTTAGEERQAALMFLTGSVISDQTPEYSEEQRKSIDEQIRKLEREDNAEAVPVSFSPRQALVSAALEDRSQMYLARNIVNRTWLRLLGTGIVDPPDQLHSGNPPSHPELLNFLTADFVEHGYDLRRLIRGIVLSDTWARSSRWSSAAEIPAAQTFAVGAIRALTPRQLAASLMIAARPTAWPGVQDVTDKPEEWLKRRTDLENQAGGWIREFEQPGENFQVAVDEALFFSNNARVRDELLRHGNDRLTGYLHGASDARSAAQRLWHVLCSRDPAPEEQQLVESWLATARGTDSAVLPPAALQSLAWAMLAGPEFRFNY